MTKISQKQLQSLADEHGTPLVVVDHEAIRQNYAKFKRYLPRVQAYYAVKANPAPEIVQTLFKAGASFDVASFPEFQLVYEHDPAAPGQGAAGVHLGQDRLREPDQGEGDARGARTSTSRS